MEDAIASNTSASDCWVNPFSDSGLNDPPIDLDSDEQFKGDELKAFFDREEKMYQSTLSSKSEPGEKSSTMASGITMRSSMLESGDSDLINQKLTMSQYIAYKSEPMGTLGDSGSSKERPYFSYLEPSDASNVCDKSDEPEFNPDFSTDPSWMKKKSLSSLSSSENLEIPSKSPDCSENWLLNNGNKSTNSDSVSPGAVSPPSLQAPSLHGAFSGLAENVFESSTRAVNAPNRVQSSSEPEDSCRPLECGDDEQPFKVQEPVQHLSPAESSELPSLYWKPKGDRSATDLGMSQLSPETDKAASQCCSYVAGHVETLSFASTGGEIRRLRPSDAATSSRSSSTSPASTVRENTSHYPPYDSMISVSDPQLSSTREITDECIDLALSQSVKRVHFMADSQRVEISHISLESQPKRLDTLLELPATPNLCSTARSMLVAATPDARFPKPPCLDSLCQTANGPEVLEGRVTPENHPEARKLMERLDQEFTRLGRDLTVHELSAMGPESWLAVFSNTSSMSTPLLMNKIKEHILRTQHGRGSTSSAHARSESSDAGGESGFEITDSRYGSELDRLSGRNSLSHLQRPASVGDDSSLHPAMHPAVSKQAGFADAISSSESSVGLFNGRHTLAALPVATTARAVTPINPIPTDHNQNLTSTVVKKMPPAPTAWPKASTAADNARTQTNSTPTPSIKCNKSHVYFGGAQPNYGRNKQSLLILNSSFQHGLSLELRIKDSDLFKIVDSDGSSLTSRRTLQLEPRQECSVDLMFLPQALGAASTKLNLYPRAGSTSKLKYTVDLSGYGGGSQLQAVVQNAGTAQILVPKTNGAFWTARFTLKNQGNVAAFSVVQPVYEDGTTVEAHLCIILPQCSTVDAGSDKEIAVLIHPPKNKKTLAPFKLRLFWGDEPLRLRWHKCISNGSALRDSTLMNDIDWAKLLQLDFPYSLITAPVGDEDMELFYRTVRVEELSIVFPEGGQDSHFVTLAPEAATVLEASTVACEPRASQRRHTTATNGKPLPDKCIAAGITELVFPSTRVGTASVQKIPLQNFSSTKQEVRVKEIVGPFSMLHSLSVVPGGYYSRLPIQFHPKSMGSHSGRVVLSVGQQSQPVIVSLKGDAF